MTDQLCASDSGNVLKMNCDWITGGEMVAMALIAVVMKCV